MVKPLNKEWALFGRKYRVAGAKGEKVDCNACHKQVSAAVNRLQSHLRVCPARASADDVVVNDANDDDPTHANGDAPLAPPPPAESVATTTPSVTAALDADPLAPPTAKRPRVHPPPPQSQQPPQPQRVWTTMPSAAYAARRLEIEEQRLALELARARREQARERLELEMLAAQAKREALATAARAYQTRVDLALARKQLRDRGIDDHEIDRLLPIVPLDGTEMAAAVDVDHATEEEPEDPTTAATDAAVETEPLDTASTTAVVGDDVETPRAADEAVL